MWTEWHLSSNEQGHTASRCTIFLWADPWWGSQLTPGLVSQGGIGTQQQAGFRLQSSGQRLATGPR